MLSITDGRGFQMKFENGWTVSVQFGTMNYCANRSYGLNDKEINPQRHIVEWNSENAEIAAWDANGTWYNFEHDTVDGWQTSNQVAEFINKIANMPAS